MIRAVNMTLEEYVRSLPENSHLIIRNLEGELLLSAATGGSAVEQRLEDLGHAEVHEVMNYEEICRVVIGNN